jgi:hypothetical protein
MAKWVNKWIKCISRDASYDEVEDSVTVWEDDKGRIALSSEHNTYFFTPKQAQEVAKLLVDIVNIGP